MHKGTKNRGGAVSLATLANESGVTPEDLNMMVQRYGKEGAKTVCRSIRELKRCGIPNTKARSSVVEAMDRYGSAALPRMFPPVKDPRTYLDQVRAGTQLHLYNSMCEMNGWSWVAGDIATTDDDGQVVRERVELDAIIALAGKRKLGMIITKESRAPFDIVHPRKWRPSDDDVETPPPFGWRIGMFDGDPEFRVEVTPLMVVAKDLEQKVRTIKDLVDHTLVKSALRSADEESAKVWQRLGEFPEYGVPDLSLVSDPEVRRRLRIGLSSEGFTGADSPTGSVKVSPLDFLDRLLTMGL